MGVYMNMCKDCKYFEYGWWIDPSTGKRVDKQHGGRCKLLLETLKMNNYKMVWLEELYIMESFGCVMFKNKG
jgi:hypothetical protein